MVDDPAYQPVVVLGLAIGVKFAAAARGGRGVRRQLGPPRPGPATARDPRGRTSTIGSRSWRRLRRTRDQCIDADDRLVATPRRVRGVRRPDCAARAMPPIASSCSRLDKPSFKVGNVGRKGTWRCDIDDVREPIVAAARATSGRCCSAMSRTRSSVTTRSRSPSSPAPMSPNAAPRARWSSTTCSCSRALLLRDPQHGPTARRRLGQRYQRLLIDEFQDTDPIQVDLAVMLASVVADDGDTDWKEATVDPGRLFFVGDPKQSIYRFRRADIATFLQARDTFVDTTAAVDAQLPHHRSCARLGQPRLRAS